MLVGIQYINQPTARSISFLKDASGLTATIMLAVLLLTVQQTSRHNSFAKIKNPQLERAGRRWSTVEERKKKGKCGFIDCYIRVEIASALRTDRSGLSSMLLSDPFLYLYALIVRPTWVGPTVVGYAACLHHG